jgi:hypothetical protein
MPLLQELGHFWGHLIDNIIFERMWLLKQYKGLGERIINKESTSKYDIYFETLKVYS